MSDFGAYLLPLMIGVILITAMVRRVKVFDCFVEGAREGLSTAAGILPSLIGLMAAVAMLRASGALEALTGLIAPAAKALGLPEQCMPLWLLRPVSGSGSLAIMEDIIRENGPDSFAGRVAAVMQGSSETTFYAITVYFGAVGIKNTRHAVPAALMGDAVCFVMSALAVRLTMMAQGGI
ncbi:MAG: spore maturation protein [Clostridiales bacterium]|nr:spore maturation protein [Clostridiales bacterium]